MSCVEERRPSWGGTAQQQGFGGGRKLSWRHERIQQSSAQGACTAKRPALEHELERRTHADALNASDRAAESRMNTEQHLRQSQRERGVIGADPVGAGERQFQSAAQGEAADGRHARTGQILELLHDGLAGADQFVAFSGGADLHEFLDVGAGDEAARLARLHDQAVRAQRRDFRKLCRKLTHHVRRQHIGRPSRHIAGKPGDTVGVDC